MTQNKYAHLKTNTHEYIKQYISLDGSGRVQYIYEARANAVHGDPCLRTQYSYHATYTTTVVKMIETDSTWDSSYDI